MRSVANRRIRARLADDPSDLRLSDRALPAPEAVERLVVRATEQREVRTAGQRVRRLRNRDRGGDVPRRVVDRVGDLGGLPCDRPVQQRKRVPVGERPGHVKSVAHRANRDHPVLAEDGEDGRAVARANRRPDQRVLRFNHHLSPFNRVPSGGPETNRESDKSYKYPESLRFSASPSSPLYLIIRGRSRPLESIERDTVDFRLVFPGSRGTRLKGRDGWPATAARLFAAPETLRSIFG